MRARSIRRGVAALALALAVGGVAVAGVKAGSSLTVRVLSAKVMTTPKFIGATAATLSRGDALTVKEVKGDWYRVEGAAKGWIHKGNVLEGKVALSTTPGGGGGGSASRDEVELAGRGFTPQLESNYRQANPQLDFSHVDAIEKTGLDPAELEAFVAEGRLDGGAP
jgi:hypothetical protein